MREIRAAIGSSCSSRNSSSSPEARSAKTYASWPGEPRSVRHSSSPVIAIARRVVYSRQPGRPVMAGHGTLARADGAVYDKACKSGYRDACASLEKSFGKTATWLKASSRIEACEEECSAGLKDTCVACSEQLFRSSKSGSWTARGESVAALHLLQKTCERGSTSGCLAVGEAISESVYDLRAAFSYFKRACEPAASFAVSTVGHRLA